MTPFTTARAELDGWSPKTLRNGQAHRVHHGAYLEPGVEPSRELSIAAARLVLPDDARLDGVSALQTFGVDIGPQQPLRFVTAHPHQVRRPGIVVRRVRSLPEGASIVTPAAAFVAAAGVLDLVELVTAGDWLVRLGRVALADLTDEAAARRGRGAALARRAAALVRERVDSPRETRLRLCLVLAGLPEPEVNPMVLVRGRPVGRVDLYLERWQVAIEYEGDQHRTDRRQWNVDIRRGEQLTSDGGAPALPECALTARRAGVSGRSPRTRRTFRRRWSSPTAPERSPRG